MDSSIFYLQSNNNIKHYDYCAIPITNISLQDRQQTLPLRKEHVPSEIVNGHPQVKRDNADNPPPPPPVSYNLSYSLFKSN